MGKLPGFIFYPGDWMKDPELRSVSSEARGLWIDMLCLMFESKRRGYLELRYGGVTAESLARMTGNLEARVIIWLEELESKGVFSRDEQGVIFCRKMVRDQEFRENTKKRVKEFRERYSDVTSPLPVNETVNEDVVVDLKNKKEAAKKATRIPEDFVPSEDHYALAKELGVNCEMEFQSFRDYYLGISGHKGAKLDWPATFRNWLRNSLQYRGNGHVRRTGSRYIDRAKSNAASIMAGMFGRDVGTGGADLRTRDSAGRGKNLAGVIEGQVRKGD